MSLILEALRKSDRENQHANNPPSIVTTKEPNSNTNTTPQPMPIVRWQQILVILLILGSMFVFYITYKPSAYIVDATRDEHADQKSAHKIKENNRIPGNPEALEIASLKTHSFNAKVHSPIKKNRSLVIPKTEPSNSQTHLLDTPHVTELPEGIRNQIPSLSYESHWYDSKPTNRIVIINSLPLKEDALLGSNLKVDTITKKGAILSYKGKQFHLLMLQTWP